jgi:FkbM family methyltransferase
MSGVRTLLRAILPFGIVDVRRKQRHFRRLGMTVPWWKTWRHEQHLRDSRYELWPRELKHAKEAWTLIDVGANEGTFALSAFHLAKPARIVAMEPQSVCQATLRQRLRHVPNCTILPIAAGAAKGTARLHRTSSNSFASTLLPLAGLAAEYGSSATVVADEEVPVDTVDSVAEGQAIGEVGLLKIDVQGAELEVLKGARRTLGRTIAVLLEINYVEHYEGACSFSDLHEYLRLNGFVLLGVSEPCLGRDNALWADAVYANSRLTESSLA